MQKQWGLFATEPYDLIRSTRMFRLYLPWGGISCFVLSCWFPRGDKRHPGDKAHVSSKDKAAGVHLDNSVCWSARTSMGWSGVDRRVIWRACGRAHITSLNSTLPCLFLERGISIFLGDGRRKMIQKKSKLVIQLVQCCVRWFVQFDWKHWGLFQHWPVGLPASCLPR